MYITAFFTHNGVPTSGLNATLRIREVATSTLVVTDDPMTDIGDGFYSYDFATYDPTLAYAIRCDGTAVLNDVERYAAATNDPMSNETVASAVWNEALGSYATSGTAGKILTTVLGHTYFTRQIESGRWKIENSQMIFYASDNTTPILTVDLLDKNGDSVTLAAGSPAERMPV